ncbi:MAG: ABC transporter ATP-binding protein [Actinomycetota bacterium]|nr:ABC transporter ATP-binding protein [Actinomycetota bacterium]
MRPWRGRGIDPAELENARLSRSLVRRVGGYATPYKWLIAGFLVTVVAGAAAGVATPLVIRSLINDAIPAQDQSAINVLALALVGTTLASAGLSLLGRYWSSRIGEGLIYDLRVALFDHVQRMPMAFFTNTQTGTLISRLNNDVVGAQSAVTGTIGTAVSDVITVVATIVTMAALDWRLTLLSLAILPLFLLPSKRVGTVLAGITRESMQLNASMNTTMTERFGSAGALLVKLFGRQDAELDRFARRASRVRDIGVRQAVFARSFFIGLSLLSAMGLAVVYWMGARMVADGSLLIGDLVAMGILVQRVYSPLANLTNARVDLMRAFVSFERVFEILDAPHAIVDAPDATGLADPAGRIELDHVTFTYPAASTTTIASLTEGRVSERESGVVLEDVNAIIEPGQLVALVGPSGAGKSTLASLLARLYDVSSGAIRVDGVDVRRLSQASLREAIGVVNQDPHLFHETVAANLRYAKPDATDAELVAACSAARIHELIASLPEGYDTLVGDRGYRLSGGEKQRLAIARMLLKDPAIVVLDEATSHLDTENEALVQAALDRALDGRTAVVIAHRLSTIIDADQILVLDDGTIAERGTHTELLADGGLYADLYRNLVRNAAETPTP